MWSFAGDKCIHAFRGGLLQAITRAAGDHSDAFAMFPAAGNEQRFGASHSLQPSCQFRARNSLANFESNWSSVARKKGSGMFQPKRGAQLRVIPQFRMRIQRQV